MRPHETNGNPAQWAVMPGDCYCACNRTVSRLPPGAYTCVTDESGRSAFARRRIEVDDLIDFPESLPAKIVEEIERFWTKGERFRKYGFRHRRGYLLYGKQGSGKSSLIHLLISHAVKNEYVAFFCEQPYALVSGIEQFRRAEPERPVLCIFEDIDALLRDSGDGVLLQWLDGHLQVDKAINIATTNYLEKLDRRIRSRPRRFDRVIRIESPNTRLRDAYFGRKVPELSTEERRHWAEISDGLSFASLAELVISVRCLDNDLMETATLLRELETHQPSCDDDDEEFYESETFQNERFPSRRSLDAGIPF